MQEGESEQVLYSDLQLRKDALYPSSFLLLEVTGRGGVAAIIGLAGEENAHKVVSRLEEGLLCGPAKR